MREAKKVEGFGLSLATPLAILGRVPPECNQASFVGMQFQLELVETLPQVLQKTLRILTVLKALHRSRLVDGRIVGICNGDVLRACWSVRDDLQHGRLDMLVAKQWDGSCWLGSHDRGSSMVRH